MTDTMQVESYLGFDVGIDPDMIESMIDEFKNLNTESNSLDSSDELTDMFTQIKSIENDAISEEEISSIHFLAYQA